MIGSFSITDSFGCLVSALVVERVVQQRVCASDALIVATHMLEGHGAKQIYPVSNFNEQPQQMRLLDSVMTIDLPHH
jgi:hypothetical protein